MRSADLGPLKIDYPENWQITMPKQRGQFVTIAPPAGIAGTDVGYGVLLNGAAPPEGQRMSIDELTHQLVQELEQNEALQPMGDPAAITVAGTQGRSVSMRALSPFPGPNGQPDKERDWLVTIPRPDGSIIFMVFVAAQSYFERFEPTYAAMLKERAVLARYNRPRQKSLLESADARVWRLRHPAGEKSCPAKGQNNPLNSDLPSHGRR